MGKLDNVKRLIAEDFESENRPLIRKLAFVINSFMEQVVREFNGNVDFDNLGEDKKTFAITVDASGIPVGNNLINSSVSNPSGITVIRALNQDSTTTYPTNQPFINFKPVSSDGRVLKILKITGLTANQEWKLTVRIVP